MAPEEWAPCVIALRDLHGAPTMEAARVVRIGRNGAHAAVSARSFPFARIGRTVRVPRNVLAASPRAGFRKPDLHACVDTTKRPAR